MTTVAKSEAFVFDGISLTIESSEQGIIKPQVASIVIDLTDGGLPTVVFTIDPKHHAESELNTKPDASSASLSEIKTWNDKILSIVADPTARASFAIEMVNQEGEAIQSIKQSGWLVTGGGMSNVSAIGNLALTVQLQHPAGLIDRYVQTIGRIAATGDWWRSASAANNPVTAFSSVLTAWSNVLRTPMLTAASGTCGSVISSLNAAAVQTNALKQMKELSAIWSSTLEYVKQWPKNEAGYVDWPFDGFCLGALSDSIKAKVMSPYVSALGSASAWQEFVDTLGNQFSLTIVPAYWRDKLYVLPYTPWGEPVIELYDSQISRISLPVASGATVTGAKVVFDGMGEDVALTSYNVAPEDTVSVTGEALYIPDGLSAGRAGRILQAGLPELVWNMFNAVRASEQLSPEDATSGYIAMDGLDEEATVDSDAGGSAYVQEIRSKLTGMALCLAKQLFLSTYKADSEVSFVTCLLLQSDGSSWENGYVVPGCVVRIRSTLDSSVILDAYLKRVIHTIDVQNKQAFTEWVGAYVRPEKGYTGVVTNGTWNPMYKSI